MFYHEIEYRQRRPNATGCVVVRKIIGSNAANIDEAYAERCRINKQYGSTLVTSTTRQKKESR